MASILILEDDEDLAALWYDILTEEGHDVTLVHDGERAWSALERQQFDLLIADIFIRRGARILADGGTLLIGKIKARSNFVGLGWLRRLPIIAVSGGFRSDSGYDPLSLARDLGADQVLRKPVRLDVLQATIADLLVQPTKIHGVPT